MPLDENLQNVNGGTPYNCKLLFATEGRGEDLPPSLVMVNPEPPYNSSVLLNNYYGRQFNSLNDVVVLPDNSAIFFTDPTYGALQEFRPPVSDVIRVQSYRYDTTTKAIKAISEWVYLSKSSLLLYKAQTVFAYSLESQPNGILLSPDAKKAYLSVSYTAEQERILLMNILFRADTGAAQGFNGTDRSLPANL